MPNLIKDNTQKSGPPLVDPKVYRQNRKKGSFWRWWAPWIGLFLVIVFIGLAMISRLVLAVNSTNATSGEKISIFNQIKHIISNPEKQLQGEAEDRINILLAGIGGAGHDGAYLADTIILVSFKPSTQEVATVSIPRDLTVRFPKYEWRKINNALAFGQEMDYPGGGEALLTKVVEDVTGQSIDYYARIDFEGFRKAIDDVGGIDILVDTAFTDYQYPDYKYGYQTITFKKGTEPMNGERALQYVRSRHGNNGEGSDFARSTRQQKVLFALKDKFISLNSIINPSRVISALNDLGAHNQTNMEIWEIIRLAQLGKGVSSENVINQVLDNGPAGLLASTTGTDGAYILQPKSGDYAEIQYLVKNIFNNSNITKENAKIEVQNSTSEAGLASKTANQLKALNYNIINVGNSPTPKLLDRTTIYDLSGGSKPYTLISLKNYLQADISSNLPAYLSGDNLNYQSLTELPDSYQIEPLNEQVDILIIIGQDMQTTPPASLSQRANRNISRPL